MFKVNNKDTRTTLLPYFTLCSSVSIVNFEHEIAGWEHLISMFIGLINYDKATRKDFADVCYLLKVH